MKIGEMIKRRQEYNCMILEVLKETIRKYPDWRFGQIISNLSIALPNVDCFYNESVETYENIPEQFKLKEDGKMD